MVYEIGIAMIELDYQRKHRGLDTPPPTSGTCQMAQK